METIVNSAMLQENISSLYLQERFSDVILIVDDEKIYAHKMILAARCGYFESLLYGGLLESKMSQIKITDASPQTFKLFLKYIYTGCLTIDVSNLETTLEVLALSHKYCYQELEKNIIKKLVLRLNLKNVCFLLNIAKLYDLKELITACYEFLDSNASAIMKSDHFKELTQASVIDILSRDTFYTPEIEIFNGVLNWCQINGKNEAVISLVRLSWLTINEIVLKVWPSGLIENDWLLKAICEIIDVKPKSSNCRGRLRYNENLAVSRYRCEVISNSNSSLAGNIGNDDDVIYVNVDCVDSEEIGSIVIRLGKPSFINHVRMTSRNEDQGYFSYSVDISLDSKNWKEVVNYKPYLCRGNQYVYFNREVAKYVKISGLYSSVRNVFILSTFEVYCKMKIPTLLNGCICPNSNVATIQKGARVITGINTGILLNGNTRNYNSKHGFTWHRIGSPLALENCITIHLAQPFVISNMRLLLWDRDSRFYKYYVETSVDNTVWDMVADYTKEERKSWQIINFQERPVTLIRITGVYNPINSGFHCVHFECPYITNEN